jgi:precorrin-6A/cobalt-precorrin-6A reductase
MGGEWRSRGSSGAATQTVLILGGTGDARRLADLLHQRGNLTVVSSLAGRTRDPALPAGETRSGGFGGPDGLAAYLSDLRPMAVVDATHPYAELISRNARRVCAALGVPRLRLDRPAWKPEPGDSWHLADGLAAALAQAAELGRRIFLSVGRVPGDLLEPYDGHWFLIRSVEPGEEGEAANLRRVSARGPFRREDEVELLEGHRIEVVVSKASGGASTYAKIEAARELKLPVVLLRRPDPPPGPLVARPEDAVAWIDQLLDDLTAGRSTWA